MNIAFRINTAKGTDRIEVIWINKRAKERGGFLC